MGRRSNISESTVGWGFGGATLILFLVGLLRWAFPPTPPLSHKHPGTCHHWIALEGAFRSPRLLCLGAGTLAQKRKRWYRGVLAAGPMCQLSSWTLVPLLRHGEAFVLERPSSRHCLWNKRWMSARRRVLLGIPLDINQARAEELQWVPGLSHRVASKIVEYRRDNGHFRSLEELVKIRGIGWNSLQRLRPFLRVNTKKN